MNPTCGNFKTQQTLVESGVDGDGCVSGEEDSESTQDLSRGGSKSIFNSLGSFNNYVNQILPNFDLPSSGQTWKFYILISTNVRSIVEF